MRRLSTTVRITSNYFGNKGSIMKRFYRNTALVLIVILISTLLISCGKAKEEVKETDNAVQSIEASNEIALKTDRSTYTQSQILAMMELTTREYNLSLEDVREDPMIWNSLVKGTVFNYAAAEISRDLCKEYGIDSFTHVEESLVKTYYNSYLGKIEKIGEKPEEFLQKMGMTEAALMTYSEDQIYKTHLSEHLKQFIEDLSEEEGMAQLQTLKNFEFRIQDEMDAKISSGTWLYNVDSMLMEEASES